MEAVETKKPDLAEITKAEVIASAEAYAEGQLGDSIGHHRAHFKAKIVANWYAGFLAHAKIMEPNNEFLMSHVFSLYHKLEQIKNLIVSLEDYGYECEGGRLVGAIDFIELQTLLGLI
jgi:hypothetical protein